MKRTFFAAFVLLQTLFAVAQNNVVGAVPDTALLYRSFDAEDLELFRVPRKSFYPETWFHYVNGNVDKAGITADLEAIAASGLAGVQFFHGGGFSDGWKGVSEPVYCLSDKWEDLVAHTAREAQRLGLRFTMQNCPGWAMSGGPWIDYDHTMRHLTYSRTDIQGGAEVVLNLPKAPQAKEPTCDYRDLMVIAFSTPLDDTQEPLYSGSFNFQPTTPQNPNVIDIRLPRPAVARSLEFSSINSFNHSFCVDPFIDVMVEAIDVNGKSHIVLQTTMPRSNWQDSHTITLSLSEQPRCSHYRVNIVNRHSMHISSVKLLSAARKQNWEGEAGWTLRQLHTEADNLMQNPEAYVKQSQILNLTECLHSDGTFRWNAPAGNWTLLRIGHINTRRKNGPAPAEATGWECNKLDPSGATLHFQNYIGRMAKGPLKGMLSNMLMDSWECYTQTWTQNMPNEFQHVARYPLEGWMPALFGYVIDNPETTAKFLTDWRRTLNNLFVNNFFGQMSRLAHEHGITCTYETAGGDITPADPMEYYKFADVPMCEFWQPFSNFLHNFNYKPIRPTVSAARMYGKPRVSAESFTSFVLTWDEHWQMLRDVANQNMLHGLTHFVFHTYTHNPGATKYFPGTSFGSNIGTPFLRGQTWWKHMPAFTSYLARCTYLLERGKPVSSVLWYLGDEYEHKPDQYYPFPVGYRYDYCNTDALLNRIGVCDGKWTTPDGITYPLMWIPRTGRLHPETLERLVALVRQGGILLAEAPLGISTLSDDADQQERFRAALSLLWPTSAGDVHPLGKGLVLSGMTIENALRHLGLQPDVQGIGNQWLHRRTEGADWYYVSAPQEDVFRGEVTFHATGRAELWNPVTGEVTELPQCRRGEFTTLDLSLHCGESAFVVFRHNQPVTVFRQPETVRTLDLTACNWTVAFPEGWGIEAPVQTTSLLPWKDMLSTAEGRAFSGTATYSTTLRVDGKSGKKDKSRYVLHLGKVEMIAVLRVNGKEVATLWSEPYQADITSYLHKGLNEIEIDVTSTWYNRLVYDASQPESARKTWVLHGPSGQSELRASGLLGPVRLFVRK
ncbi:MAG: hypothetical protein IJ020_02525 [Bacteroidaceae bacterium]|nr:hypothetical protein [Bacteroidaceae bacterium]